MFVFLLEATRNLHRLRQVHIDEGPFRHSSSGPSRDIGFPPHASRAEFSIGPFSIGPIPEDGPNGIDWFPQLPPLAPVSTTTNQPPVPPFGYLQPIVAGSAPA